MRSLLAFICIVFSSISLFAAAKDSIGVENTDGKQTIVHKVKLKETFYSIGRLYGVNPKDLMSVNRVRVLQPGSIIRVPTQRPFFSEPAEDSLPDNELNYKVGAKETLYSIAKRFNTSVQELQKINGLNDTSVSVGKVIKVRANTGPYIDPGLSTAQSSADMPAETDKVKAKTNRYGLTERSEQGIAVWIEDENLDGSRMLALHRTAPVGTVMKITYPMTGKSTFAKVVGRFTENQTTQDVVLVMSKAVADLLGALDKRFQVNLDYGLANE